jgi:hypothetical protein
MASQHYLSQTLCCAIHIHNRGEIADVCCKGMPHLTISLDLCQKICFLPAVSRGWRKLHNEEFIDFVPRRVLCSSPSIIKMITSRRIRLAEHVVCLGEKRYTYTVMMGKHGEITWKT